LREQTDWWEGSRFPVDGKAVSIILNEIAVMMELLGENPFKVNAYYTAARTVELLKEDLGELAGEDQLRHIKGIGSSLAKQIGEILHTGTSQFYQELRAKIPYGLFALTRISGLGPKKISLLHKQLGISDVDRLEEACRKNKLLELPGFGAKTQENILKGIAGLRKYTGQHLFVNVWGLAENLEKELKKHPHVRDALLAGSLRRRKEVVKDIDILVSSDNPEEVAEYFAGLPQVETVVGSGPTKTSVVLHQGIQADLRIVEQGEFPYALHHFTGSQEHNIAMRHRAKKMGLKMNEYGLFDAQGKKIMCQSEKEIFRTLGLDNIPPELRENMGEIEAAEQGKLPCLVELKDIKGVFHIHTVYSDGTASIREMVEETRRRGWNYLGISDHSQSAFYANGLKVEQINKQLAEIDRLNEENPDFTIFKGIEADIRKDGSLDYPDEILAQFDFVIASIHSGFKMTEEEATERLIKAMQNPYTTMLGHPTGRILLGREGYPVSMKAMIEAARDCHVIIELNASPYRLDLDWRWCRYAKELGVKIALNPDAHHLAEFDHMEAGIGAARKGWLEAFDVFNTRPREQVKDYLRLRKGPK